jgi:F0F1-type ATP synthase beta subunit
MSEVFSGKKGKLVELGDTIEGFGSLLEGAGDDYPEIAFYMTGNMKEAFEQGKKLAEAMN